MEEQLQALQEENAEMNHALQEIKQMYDIERSEKN